jgi:hypothetical protein
VKNLHRGHVAKSFGLKDLPDESNNHTLKERQSTFGSLTKFTKPTQPIPPTEYLNRLIVLSNILFFFFA